MCHKFVWSLQYFYRLKSLVSLIFWHLSILIMKNLFSIWIHDTDQNTVHFIEFFYFRITQRKNVFCNHQIYLYLELLNDRFGIFKRMAENISIGLLLNSIILIFRWSWYVSLWTFCFCRFVYRCSSNLIMKTKYTKIDLQGSTIHYHIFRYDEWMQGYNRLSLRPCWFVFDLLMIKKN